MEWTKEQVGRWIAEQVGLPEYRLSFEENDITSSELLNLNTLDLKDLNVTKIGHRKRIELAIDHLKRQQLQQVKRKISDSFASRETKKIKLDNSPTLDIIDDMKSLLLIGFPGICVICREEKDNIFPLQECKGCAQACVECLQIYIKDAIDRKKFPITCHHVNCRHEISTSDLDMLLKRVDMERFQRMGLESLVAPYGVTCTGQRAATEDSSIKFLHCPTPNCSYIFAIDEKDEKFYHIRCEICHEHYCLKCRVKYHHNQSCLTYRKEKIKFGGEDELLLMAYLQSKKVKACPSCSRYIERSTGCSRMSCLCGCKFCYLCGNMQCTCAIGTIDIDEELDE